MPGSFDPTSFMDASFEGQLDTKLVPVPIGEWAAVIEDPKMTEWKSKDGEKSGWKLSMMLKIEAPEVAAITKRDINRVRHDIMLDITENGTLDMGPGKNIGLGQLREALGMNKPGEKFSFRSFDGKMLKTRVGHRTDGENTYAESKAVTALS